ncbi:hypothetical protein IQ265_17015 [Nodosilinea sp. LEGE 06152]|uniref:hypothetical protein n=1 Tax=Nodosilinea sp. LEGE 06152 TaxID=2777966 RepID=UPI0018808F42|nr:hypothetical protein [Nodosilinea sp. LEGE 06152]MBE9158521.1 hypothetical protein [Nodosilinea sp. LEGE 06152]
MPLPPAVRYRLVRLKAISRPLRRPVVWGTLAALGLGAVVVPQYLGHPEWRSRYDAGVDSPAVNSGTDLSALTNEDLADLAEIDNLALLLNDLQPTTSTALLEAPAADADRLALPQAAPAEGTASPFTQYLERSRFRFSPAPSGATGEGESDIAIENRPSTLAPGQRQPSRAASTEALPPSPLQQALSERRSQSAQSTRAEPAAETGAAAASSTEALTSGLTPPPWMVEGSLPGVDQRFIRTTPQMSPPPGTTGYTQPPGLSPSPAVPAPEPGAIAPARLNLDFGSPAMAPAGNGPGRSQPGPLNNSVSTPLPQPTPPPFSAPRPPGVYSGNGYINTFSDPTGPPAN